MAWVFPVEFLPMKTLTPLASSSVTSVNTVKFFSSIRWIATRRGYPTALDRAPFWLAGVHPARGENERGCSAGDPGRGVGSLACG